MNGDVAMLRDTVTPCVLNSHVIDEMIAGLGVLPTGKLIECFLDDVRKIESLLPATSAAPDLKILVFLAHSMKGTADMYGASRLAMEAATLHGMCRSGDMACIEESIRCFRAACRSTIREYRRLVILAIDTAECSLRSA